MPRPSALLVAAATWVVAAGPATPPAGAASGTTTRPSVNLRSRPGDGRVVARLPRATRLAVGCQQVGPVAPGRLGPSRVWDRVTRADGRAGWVADGYLDTGTSGLIAPVCGSALPAPSVPGALSGACAVRPPAAPPPPATPEALIATVLPAARVSAAASGVPVAVTLAQAILETGGGRFTAAPGNLFGLKAQATGAPGVFAFGPRAVGCVLTKTREAERGRLVLTIGAFRAYASPADSVADHDERLTGNPVYRAAFAHVAEPRRFAREIARHYATDPAYADKLLALMERYGLEQVAAG